MKMFFLLFFRTSVNKEDDFPNSYKTNSEKEQYMLSCCENFHRQYKLLYRDRKLLFLTPLNECGVEVSLYYCSI